MRDSRVNFLASPVDAVANDIEKGARWTSAGTTNITKNIINLEGDVIKTESYDQIFGSFYFYHDQMIESVRDS